MQETDPQYNAVLFRLTNARIHRKLTQGELAKRVGIPRPSLTLIESGKQKLTVAQAFRFAGVLGVPVQWLLLGTFFFQGEERKYNRLWELPSLKPLPTFVPAPPAPPRSAPPPPPAPAAPPRDLLTLHQAELLEQAVAGDAEARAELDRRSAQAGRRPTPAKAKKGSTGRGPAKKASRPKKKTR